jgi:hypothetical protein
LLFFAALAATGLLLALALSLAPGLASAAGIWLMPAVTFVMFVAMFFLARRLVLPPRLAEPAWRALGVLAAWMAATLAVWQAVMWVLMQAAGVRRGTLLILLGCLLVSVKVLERVTARRGGRLLP